jgi:hypothetical protein
MTVLEGMFPLSAGSKYSTMNISRSNYGSSKTLALVWD